MALPKYSFNEVVLSHWQSLSSRLLSNEVIVVDSDRLDLATVILVARYDQPVTFGATALAVVTANAEQVHGRLQGKDIIYGVNTGFGANADMRTQAHVAISQGLIRGLHFGVLTGGGSNQVLRAPITTGLAQKIHLSARPNDDPDTASRMPETWVRAAMYIRGISLSKGASGVRPQIVTTLFELLNKDIIPIIPLRGSVSASGDLSPLSYIGGVMQGKPALKVSIKSHEARSRSFETADKALRNMNIQPITVGPKEGLAIVNGTAPSAAVGALALHEVLGLALLSQALTAASVEATCGSRESFAPFFSDVRPHDGQTEAAQNILSFLSGSQLATDFDDASDASRQDRYSTRTAPQWIGPVLEDLVLAHKQVVIEINSVTDNPIVDRDGKFLHGGNFQAKSITSAMEKTRQACQSLGQMLFAQCTELINPATNRGLAANLVVDEPNESFMWKGTDIYVAALQSELGYLCNPAGSHVQFAEMGNQAINSLALISGRYTLTATDVLSQLAAAHLVALCQALDLRTLQIQFLATFETEFRRAMSEHFEQLAQPKESMLLLQTELWTSFKRSYMQTAHMTSETRFMTATRSSTALLLQRLSPPPEKAAELASIVLRWHEICTEFACCTYQTVRKAYLATPDAIPLLGKTSRALYHFVRVELGVPFFGEEFIRQAEWETRDSGDDGKRPIFQTMGEMITTVYEAIRSGSLYTVVIECLEGSVTTKS